MTDGESPNQSQPLETQNVTLRGSRVAADIIKTQIKMKSRWGQVSPSSNTIGVLYKVSLLIEEKTQV